MKKHNEQFVTDWDQDIPIELIYAITNKTMDDTKYR